MITTWCMQMFVLWWRGRDCESQTRPLFGFSHIMAVSIAEPQAQAVIPCFAGQDGSEDDFTAS